MCAGALCTTFQRHHLTLPKGKYSFILIESFIVTINHDDVYIYSCLMSSLNVVIIKTEFGMVFSLDGTILSLVITNFFKKSLCYLP